MKIRLPENKFGNRRFLRVFWLIYVLLLLNSANLYAQSVAGTVKDRSSGDALYGVNILAYRTPSVSGASLLGTATDMRGRFEITFPAAGVYYLKVSYIGYKTMIDSVVIPARGSVTKDIQLTADDVMLDQVLVQSKRDTSRQAGFVAIPVEALNTIPTFGGERNLFGAIVMMPGVAVSSELSNGLYIRGSSPDQLLVLVDNVILYNPFHLGGFASAFNTDAVEDIQLIKGAFPAKYGGRLSGVLDVKLKENLPGQFKGLLALGTITSRAAVEGYIIPELNYIISYRTFYLDKIFDLLIPETTLPFYHFNDLNAKVNLRASAKDRVRLSGYFGSDNLFTKENKSDASFDINWENSMLSASWLHLSGEKKFTEVTATYSGYSFSSLLKNNTPDAFKSDYYSSVTISDFGLKVDGQYFSDEKHTLKNGLEVIQHSFTLGYNNYYDSKSAGDERLQTNFIAPEVSGYLQDEFQVHARLFLNSGLRFYYLPKSDFMSAEPRVSLVFALTDKFFIKAAAAQTNQFVHLLVRNDVALPTDIWFPSGKKIQPSKANQGVLGFEYEFAEKEYLLTGEIYYKGMRDIYDYADTASFSPESPLEDQLSAGTGKAYGAELFFNKRTGDFTGWVGFTLAKTERNFEKVNAGRPFPPRYDIRLDLSVVASYKLTKNIELGATWTLKTGQAITMPTGIYYFPGVFSANSDRDQIFLNYSGLNNYRMPSFHKLDMSINYSTEWLGKKTKLNFSVYNVYNHSNPFARYLSFPAGAYGDPELRQFTLFPVFPSFSILTEF